MQARVVIQSVHGVQKLTALIPLAKALSVAAAENKKLTQGRAVVVNALGYELQGSAR